MQIRRCLPYFRYLCAALFTTRAPRQILLSINRDRYLTGFFAEKGEILSALHLIILVKYEKHYFACNFGQNIVTPHLPEMLKRRL
jgi:hypothetical protein